MLTNSQVDVDMIDPDNCFTLIPTGDTQAVTTFTDDSVDGTRKPHTASVIINVGEKAAFDVVFAPKAIQRSQAHVRLSVVNNQYEDSVVQLVGEGYQDDITVDNIRNLVQYVDPEQEEGNMAEDDVPGNLRWICLFSVCLTWLLHLLGCYIFTASF